MAGSPAQLGLLLLALLAMAPHTPASRMLLDKPALLTPRSGLHIPLISGARDAVHGLARPLFRCVQTAVLWGLPYCGGCPTDSFVLLCNFLLLE